LRTLVGRGVLTIAPASDGSAYQEYVLTEKGRALFPVIVALRQWGEDHLFALHTADTVLIDRKGGPILSFWGMRTASRLLAPRAVGFRGRVGR
jgi:HxlR-like helix-turn-helix